MVLVDLLGAPRSRTEKQELSVHLTNQLSPIDVRTKAAEPVTTFTSAIPAFSSKALSWCMISFFATPAMA